MQMAVSGSTVFLMAVGRLLRIPAFNKQEPSASVQSLSFLLSYPNLKSIGQERRHRSAISSV
jgi:hypothetical protein